MADKAPEIHAKALLASVANIGTAAAAIDEAAVKLAHDPLSTPASRPNGSPVSPKK